ncbi:hypothetical protein DID77_02920 [Candidatus Marinamargulisbacteria bacterium SCGC AG-439-L15]|nr:hypothetical protein DID77_02920 [Candidatus Marinamargulisbacteria bacterium SCGC AG-439-L15]
MNKKETTFLIQTIRKGLLYLSVVSLFLCILTTSSFSEMPTTIYLQTTLSHKETGLLTGTHTLHIKLLDGENNALIWESSSQNVAFNKGMGLISIGPLSPSVYMSGPPVVWIGAGEASTSFNITAIVTAHKSLLSQKALGFLYDDGIYIDKVSKKIGFVPRLFL